MSVVRLLCNLEVVNFVSDYFLLMTVYTVLQLYSCSTRCKVFASAIYCWQVMAVFPLPSRPEMATILVSITFLLISISLQGSCTTLIQQLNVLCVLTIYRRTHAIADTDYL